MMVEIKRLVKTDLGPAKQGVGLFLESNESVSTDNALIDLLKKESFYFVAALFENKVVGRLIGYEFNLYKNNAKEV